MMKSRDKTVQTNPGKLQEILRQVRWWVLYLWRASNPRVIPRRSLRPTVSQVTEVSVTEEIDMEVYWLVFNNQAGPAASVYAFGDELMRFDCFGRENGHFHLNMRQSKLYPGGGSARIYLSMGSVDDQIREAGFWLSHNLKYATTTNRSSRIRSLVVDAEALADAAQRMMGIMFELVERNSGSSGSVGGIQEEGRVVDEAWD